MTMYFFITFILIAIFITSSNGLHAFNSDKGAQSVSQIVFIKDDNLPGNTLFYDDIISLGYQADVIPPDSATLERILQYELAILSTGNNPFACQNTVMRLSLQAFIIEHSGKVIIEGGHTGYISAVFPFYLGFRNKVIMIDDWVRDGGGSLTLSPNYATSYLAQEPNTLPVNIEINYENVYDQDVCSQSEFSEAFYGASSNPGKVGILVAPSVSSPRVINFFVYYSAIAKRSDAKNLINNSIYNLIGSPVSVNYNSEILPADFELFQNYPNPFNPVTSIAYRLHFRSAVSLKVYDMLGNLVSTLVDSRKNSGEHRVSWDAGNYASGMYYYSLTIDGVFADSKKMLLVK